LLAIGAGRTKAAADDELTTEKKVLDQKKALREISAEDAFQVERQLEDRSYAAELAALQAKRMAIHGDNDIAAKERAALDAEAESKEREHQQRLSDIDRAATMERNKYAIQAQGEIQNSFAKMVEGFLHGVTSMGDLLRAFAKSVADTFIHLIAQKFTEQIFNATGANQVITKVVNFVTEGIAKMVTAVVGGKTAEVSATTAAEGAKTSAVVAGTTVRETAEAGAAATSTASTASTAIANIGAKAWESAAAVYASIAAIPYVGPFLAPAMAIAAGVAVLGFASRIMSSEGGEYKVDEDRLNFVHKNETILPAPFAEGLRNLVGQGGLNPVIDAAQRIDHGYRMPQSRLNQIQSPQVTPVVTQQGMQGGGGGRGAGGQAPKLSGASAGDFFIATRKDLVKVLSVANRDFRGPRTT
jgi:hypothetical protein